MIKNNSRYIIRLMTLIYLIKNLYCLDVEVVFAVNNVLHISDYFA